MATTRNKKIFTDMNEHMKSRIIRYKKQFINAFKRTPEIKPHEYNPPPRSRFAKKIASHITSDTFTKSYLLKLLIGYNISCSFLKVRQHKKVIEAIRYMCGQIYLYGGANSKALPRAKSHADLRNHDIFGM